MASPWDWCWIMRQSSALASEVNPGLRYRAVADMQESPFLHRAPVGSLVVERLRGYGGDIFAVRAPGAFERRADIKAGRVSVARIAQGPDAFPIAEGGGYARGFIHIRRGLNREDARQCLREAAQRILAQPMGEGDQKERLAIGGARRSAPPSRAGARPSRPACHCA